jgi:hypothetical protein
MKKNSPNLIIRIKTKDFKSKKNYFISVKKILDFLDINYQIEMTPYDTQKTEGDLSDMFKDIAFIITKNDYDELPF